MFKYYLTIVQLIYDTGQGPQVINIALYCITSRPDWPDHKLLKETPVLAQYPQRFGRLEILHVMQNIFF